MRWLQDLLRPGEKKVTGPILAGIGSVFGWVGIDGTEGALGIANLACFAVFAAKRELPHGIFVHARQNQPRQTCAFLNRQDKGDSTNSLNTDN
jgi:hypothetical protein